jgi:uncharacterized membrane protein
MSATEAALEVHADTQRVYEMWTEFEHYSDFIPGVVEVRRSGETLTHWTTNWSGEPHEMEVQVVQMDPEQRIVFQSLQSTPPVRGIVTFDPTGDGTRITFSVENDPGDPQAMEQILRQSLERFKAIAEQGPPTRWPV